MDEEETTYQQPLHFSISRCISYLFHNCIHFKSKSKCDLCRNAL